MSPPYAKDRDRPRPGGNQFGAGSPYTQQGMGETPIMAEADVEFAGWAPRLGIHGMSDERRAVIWGLYRLAAWVADHPEIPVPTVDARVFPPLDGWDRDRAFVDEVADALDVSTEYRADGDHYAARTQFGSVEVSSTAIRPEHMARYDAEASYRGCVEPDAAGGGDGR